MEDPAITAFTQQLEINPGDWFIRSHLAGLLEAQGDLHGAAEVILAAPAMPVAADHMLAAVRILTPVNPAAALPYLQLLGQLGAAAQAAPVARPVVPQVPEVPEVPVAAEFSAVAAVPEGGVVAGWDEPVPLAVAGEVHLTEREKPKFSLSKFALVVGAHVGLLLVGAIWVISEKTINKKDELKFDAQPPRVSAARGTENAVKMAKKKSSSRASSAALAS